MGSAWHRGCPYFCLGGHFRSFSQITDGYETFDDIFRNILLTDGSDEKTSIPTEMYL